MILGVVKESFPGERRVALVPDVVKTLVPKGFSVIVESNAGIASGCTDAHYVSAGAEIVGSSTEVLAKADILLSVQCPSMEIAGSLRSGTTVIAPMYGHRNTEVVAALKAKNVTSHALELIPRISRAQSMDILSSMASVAGYKAVLIAAVESGKFFPMLVTAAGTIAPTKALIIGAGVAGLQAIASAKRIGAVVESFDVRPAVKEQILSLGAKFIDIDLGDESTETSGGYAKELSENAKRIQQEVLAKHVALSDVVISTAAIPGKPAPRIITTAMVNSMKPGSVIVDLAAETGGNCELTKAGEAVVHNDVTIIGPINIAATLPIHASQMFAKNLSNFLQLFVTKDGINLNVEDEIIVATRS